MRIDLQELWSSGYSWDEVLPDEIQSKWKTNVQVLNQLLKYEFKRKLKPDNAVGMPEIYGFCEELSAEMKPPIGARTTSCDEAEFSAAKKELRDNPLFEHLMRTCSTFSKARKTLAYVLRFVNNTRMKTKNRDSISPKELTESELRLF